MEEHESVVILSEFINNYAKDEEYRQELHDALSELENIALRNKDVKQTKELSYLQEETKTR